MNIDNSASNVDEQEKISEMLKLVLSSLASLESRVDALSEVMSENGSKQEWYDIAEAAKRFEKAPFTVREWCRLGRINAMKRECGRGGKREWMISRKEVERVREKGLLPTRRAPQT